MRHLLFALLLAGCAADKATSQPTDVGITVLPVASSKTALPATARVRTETPSANPNERDPVVAERYFSEARSLMSKGQVEQACGLFQKSMDADPALGTMLNVADCNERLGNIAAACNAYRDVEAQAGAAGQDARGELARSRAEKLGCR